MVYEYYYIDELFEILLHFGIEGYLFDLNPRAVSYETLKSSSINTTRRS